MNRVEKQIAVRAPADTVYQVWRNFENFPSFMENIEEVRVTGDNRSHWKAKGPLGTSAEWDAEVTEDRPAQAIAWRSVAGSQVQTAGRVEFEGHAGATVLNVTMEYDAPGGTLGDVVTKIFANPERRVEADLERFKEGLEGGQQFSYPGAAKLARDRSVDEMGAPAGASAARQIKEQRPAEGGAELIERAEQAGSSRTGRERSASGDAGTNNYDAARGTPPEPAMRDDAHRVSPNRGHGTPGGSLGSLNETDDGLRDADRAEKGDDLKP